MNEEAEKLRGRFSKGLDQAAAGYVASIPFDWRLFRHDIRGSIAHARMLARQEIIPPAEAEQIISGLNGILRDIEDGKVEFRLDLEDIHMNIESLLADRIGDMAGKLHTARSRNDQVALDLRLFVREAITGTMAALREFQRVLLDVAEAQQQVIMPGYTHLQRAQPVLFAHHLLAYFEMFQRDVERFRDCRKRVDVLPLGSGALAGVTYPIDRDFVARELGFARVGANSLDSVSDRDFAIEYQAAAAITMMHLSRLAEEAIVWSSAEFGFIEIDDAFATGSSIMPQKKNPDMAELARGKTGRVYGHLVGILTTMKALPLSYNRDMQEDKEGLFDTVDTLGASLKVLTGMVSTMKVNSDRMRQAAAGNYSLATDVADYLVRKGLSFRHAHGVVGRLVQHAMGRGKGLDQLTIEEYKEFSPLFESDVLGINLETSLAARATTGGTAPVEVQKALARAREVLKADSSG